MSMYDDTRRTAQDDDKPMQNPPDLFGSDLAVQSDAPSGNARCSPALRMKNKAAHIGDICCVIMASSCGGGATAAVFVPCFCVNGRFRSWLMRPRF